MVEGESLELVRSVAERVADAVRKAASAAA